MVIELFLAGALGGLARALYGVMKSVSAGKTIKPWYFLTTLITAGILGGITGLIFEGDIRLCALAGYVGSDVLENVAVAVLPKTFTIKK